MVLVPTRVAPSGIHGNGLSAVEAIPRGTPFYRFAPGFDRTFTAVEVAALPEPARSHIRHFAYFNPATGDAVLSGDHACFMKHSPTPNTGAPPDAVSLVTTLALRDIAAGEELTCDYRAFDADAAVKLGLVPRDTPRATR